MPNAGDEQIDVAAGQIAAADAAREKNVAADEQFILMRKETKTAGAMAGNVQNLEIGAKKLSIRRFFDEEIRCHRFDFEFESKIAKKFPVGNHRRGERVTTDLAIKLAFDPGNILDVIDVSVRQKQKFESDIKRTRPFAGALWRVEKNVSLRRFKQIAIGMKNPAAKSLVNHRNSLYPSLPTAEVRSFYE